MLADKQPIEVIADEGVISSLYEFSEVFLKDDGAVAIYNDITNFLRVGDITQIKENGDIEIIEVKSREKRGGRITRQKQRMSELVEFFNTGLTSYDGRKLVILDSSIRQRTYLSQMHDCIQVAMRRGRESLLIGKYLILEFVDFKKPNNIDVLKAFFDSKHRSVKDEWWRRKDFVLMSFFTDKMDYSKNCAPYSIYPFDIKMCADIMMGRLLIGAWFNFSEILRTIINAKWDIVDSLLSRSKSELESLRGQEVDSVPFLVIRRGPCEIHVPPSLIARLQYELLAPSTMLAEFEEIYERQPKMEQAYYLTNYIDEQRIWH